MQIDYKQLIKELEKVRNVIKEIKNAVKISDEFEEILLNSEINFSSLIQIAKEKEYGK